VDRFAIPVSGEQDSVKSPGRDLVIILDTNVVSELMRAVAAPNVLKSVRRYSADELHTTAITLAEILYGIELLPSGKRKNELISGSERLFTVVLGNRILAFDEHGAKLFSAIAADRRKLGRPIAELDAQIAAIARLHGATLATRNTADFEGCGIRLVNPWVD